MAFFRKSKSEQIISHLKNRLTKERNMYLRELESLPEGRIENLTVAGKDMLYLVRYDAKGKKSGKYIGNLGRVELDKLSEQLDRRYRLEHELNEISKELRSIERAIRSNKIDEYLKEYEKKNPLI